MNVAAQLAQFLIEKGCRHVFGYQGGAVTKIIDEMMGTGKIEYVQNYHEQASAFCADAYSRVSNYLGVAIATSGPGATNLVTGIANAYFDSVPSFFITGQEQTSILYRDCRVRQNGFQDMDIVSLVNPITKYATLIKNPKELRFELEKAYHISVTGRPGPVLLDIPIDIQFKEIDWAKLKGFKAPRQDVSALDLAPLVRLLSESRRPLVLVGGGVQSARATEQLRELVRMTSLPVVSTLNGLDAYEGSFGFAGLHGNTCANLAVQNADLLLVLGARFGQQQVGKYPEDYTQAQVVHVDIDENELGRVFPNEMVFRSDLRAFLLSINRLLGSSTLPDWSEWSAKIHQWRDLYHTTVYLNETSLDPVRVVEEMRPLFRRDAILTSDVGQNQMWVAQGFSVKQGQRLLNSCGHGSMGYSLPAAIGSKFAFPDRQVIALMGDGGLQMNLQELMLVSQRRLGIKCVVFNNHTLGMMREKQKRHYGSRYYGAGEEDYACVDLRKLSDAYGLQYRKVTMLGDVASLESEFSDDRAYIIEVSLSAESRLSNRYDETEIFHREKLSA
jgi:acetolactate synthase I/II/III large subunit